MGDLPHRIPEPEVMSDAEEARVYRQADFSQVNQRFAERFAELWRPGPLPHKVGGGKPRFLDLGCGPADIPLRVRRLIPGCRIAGLDMSEAMLREGLPARTAQGAGRDLLLLRADARRIPFPDGEFDGIFSNSLLHHLPDSAVPGVWAEVRRVAAPGAVVFIRDLFRPAGRTESAELRDLHVGGEPDLMKTLFYNSLLAAFTPDELRRQLAAAGLSGLTVQTVTDRHVDVFGRLG